MPHIVTSMNESIFREPYLKKENEIMTTCKMATQGREEMQCNPIIWLATTSLLHMLRLCQSPRSTLSG